ncbi:hypothetical protein [Sorangium sp. So ce1335]|uniref:hypothetical protein n=1 Tax=Sorangium sp. So ce1335 TaxID=3133335 RepID=UPI003F613566
MRLVAYSMLPPERFPKARRAGELVNELFGDDGLSFLSAEYSVQNTVMASIVEHIQEAGLQPEIDALAGPEFLEQIGNVVPRYDMMVKDRLQKEAAATSNLTPVVRAIQSAIVSYATKVAGMVDEDDPATIETVRRALRPLDAHRESSARRAQGGTKGEAASGAPAAPASPAKPATPAAPASPASPAAPATGAGAVGGGSLGAPA